MPIGVPDAGSKAIGPLLEEARRRVERGEMGIAIRLFGDVLKQVPGQFDALLGTGIIAFQVGQTGPAIDYLSRAVAANPRSDAALGNLAQALLRAGRVDEALARSAEAVALAADSPVAHYNRGNVLVAVEKWPEALASFDRAIFLKPDLVEAYNNRGIALKQLSLVDAALASYDRAIALRPDFADAVSNRGLVLQAMGRRAEALASFDRAIALEPRRAKAYGNRALFFQASGDLDSALADFERALALAPRDADLHYGKAALLVAVNRLEEALAGFDAALAIDPTQAGARLGRARVLFRLDRLDDCLADLARVAAEMPNAAEPHHLTGAVLSTTRRLDEAGAAYDRALALEPGRPSLMGEHLNNRLHSANWHDLPRLRREVSDAVLQGRRVATPFPVVAAIGSRRVEREAGRLWTAHFPPSAPSPARPAAASGRIRLGYFSSDYYDHATCHLLAGVIERQDRDRFECIAFSFGPRRDDPMRHRMERAFDRFEEIDRLSDAGAAERARELGIDIAIDMKGFTRESRPGLFGFRAAPVQVNYLGYPATMGTPCMDYLVADRTLVPAEHRPDYAEKIAYLPDCYQPTDDRREVPGRVFSRAELELPEDAFVFCCFNACYKITPESFDSWARILRRVPRGVLWMLPGSNAAAARLRAEWAARGLAPERLVLANKIGMPDHLARHRAADLFLDTLPYNAHTTASDALWMGLPVLTRLGETMAGRVCGSILRAVGLPELVTSSQEEYEEMAVAIATRPDLRRTLSETLARNRLTMPLFDTTRYTRHLEAAFAEMHRRAREGLAPEHIFLS